MLLNFYYLFISGAEIGIVVFIIVIFFGADKIPELARGIGKGIKEIKHASNDIKNEIKNSSNIIEDNTTKNINKEIDKVNNEIQEVTGSIKRDI